MDHALPDAKLRLRAHGGGPRHQAFGIIEQRIELASPDVERRQIGEIGQHRHRQRILPRGGIGQIVVRVARDFGRAQKVSAAAEGALGRAVEIEGIGAIQQGCTPDRAGAGIAQGKADPKGEVGAGGISDQRQP